MIAPRVVEGRLDVEWDKLFEPDIRQTTQRVAFEALREEVARGFDNQPLVVTDGVPRRAPDQVRAFGKIEWIARANAVEIALWIKAEVERRSPVLTGAYQRGHILMLNGAEVKDLRGYRPGDRIQIVNPLPYAKKLEGRPTRTRRGRGGQRERVKGVRGASSQAPQGVYRVVHRLAVARYGRSVFIDFKYVPLSTGLTVRGRGGKRRAHVYPAIQIYLKPN
jgi:hypothetical protein